MNTVFAAELALPFWKAACARAPNADATTRMWATIAQTMAVPPSSVTAAPAPSSTSATATDGNSTGCVRAYHNLRHVWELCDFYARDIAPHVASGAVACDPDVVLLTAFFHDVVYDATRGDNEERSAEAWRAFALDAQMPADVVDQVSRITLATKKHLEWKAPPLEGAIASTNEAMNTMLFLDMDLAILGAPRDRYAEYAEQIRCEWRHIADAAFFRGRLAFLESMQQRSDSLFRTPLVQQLRGGAVKGNVAWEIDLLRTKLATVDREQHQ